MFTTEKRSLWWLDRWQEIEMTFTIGFKFRYKGREMEVMRYAQGFGADLNPTPPSIVCEYQDEVKAIHFCSFEYYDWEMLKKLVPNQTNQP